MGKAQLKPAVNEEKRRKQNGITHLDYVKAANEFGYEFRLNVLEDALEVNGQRMSNVVDAEIICHLHAKGLRNVDLARRAFLTDANSNHHHPVKGYLQSLEWDGIDHIAGLARYFTDNHDLITYADGTQRTVIHAWLLRWLIGSVAKVYNSQDAQNPMLVLDGGQGRGKSYFVKWLASPVAGMHFEGSIRPDDKDYLRYLSTRWIWEVSELGATMRKADREALKAFITLQDVTYRPAHGQYVLHKPALANFIGTVNFEGALLNDPTGHRRFMPVEIVDLDWEYAKNIDVNQVWAQAYHLYRSGVSWKLTDNEKTVHLAICEHYEVEDVLEGHLREWFKIEPQNENLFTRTTAIIHHLKTYAGVSGRDRALTMQVAATLNKLGLRKGRKEHNRGYIGIEPVDTPNR
ncbi:MAG: VapE family protein [Caldilineaceae bacterium]